MIHSEIAVITASGKAYYKLVKELKGRSISFLSLIPGDTIPFYVRMCITTDSERKMVQCPNILVYNEEEDPKAVVDKGLQILKGKEKYRKLIVGVDPGKKMGVAFVGDEEVLQMKSFYDVEVAANEISKRLHTLNADKKIVRVGNGAGEYQFRLIKLLDARLPINVKLESVEEERTAKGVEKPLKHDFRDLGSAIKISTRNGRDITRKRVK